MAITYALLGALFSSIMIYLSKVVSQRSKNPLIIAGILQIMSGIGFIPFLFFEDLHFANESKIIVSIFVMVFLYTLGNIFGFLSYKYVDISLCGIIDQLSLVLLYVGSILIFGETLSVYKTAGVFLILIANILIIQRTKSKEKSMRGILYRIAFVAFMGGANLIDSQIITDKKVSMFLYSFLIWLLPGIGVLLYSMINAKLKDVSYELKYNWKGLISLALTGILTTIFVFFAYQRGEKSIVFPVLKLSSILLVIIGVLFLKERKNLQAKVLAVVIVFLGIYLISLSY
jgi:bacterial/archaeal transporter family protein